MAVPVNGGALFGWSTKTPIAPIANPPRKRRNRSDFKKANMAFFLSVVLAVPWTAMNVARLSPRSKLRQAVSTNAPQDAMGNGGSQFRFATGYRLPLSICKTARGKFSVSEMRLMGRREGKRAPSPCSLEHAVPYFRAAQASWIRVQAFCSTSSDVA